MKKYIVQYGNNEKEAENINAACELAEELADKEKITTYVWVETNGVREEDPFFYCTWSI